MTLKTCCVTAALIVGMAAPAVVAHHSFSAEFDITKTIKVTGKVSSVRWSNPHAWIYIDVPGEDGKVVNWAFEMHAANTLYRRGWRKDDVLPGLAVTVEGMAGAQWHADRQHIQHHAARRPQAVCGNASERRAARRANATRWRGRRSPL